jgi:metallo-beta-lactamase family protein
MKLTFLGAAGTVTGSRTLVRSDDAYLMVDCGLFQGWKELRLQNREPFGVRVDLLDAVVLTHAHLDHSGACPLLVREGFQGPIHATDPTADLCGILWRDAAYLQQEDAERANRKGYSRHHPALPLFDLRDAEQALGRLRTERLHRVYDVRDLRITHREAGHILGATSVLVENHRRRVLFSGDVGRAADPIQGSPEPLPDDLDVLVLESTYGDRRHEPVDPEEQLGRIIRETVARGGQVLVPTFAVGRVQRLLHHLARLKASERIPDVPVYLNSPLADAAQRLFVDHPDSHRLTSEEVRALVDVVTVVRSTEESKRLTASKAPAVILAGAGMVTGGRILHHLAARLEDSRSTVLLVGFQAGGTRGDRLLKGETTLRMFGQDVPVLAHVERLDNLSAHADQDELMAWLGTARRPPRRVILNHGEPTGSEALAQRITAETGIPAEVATMRGVFEL